jgi:hypothetical protein
MSGNLTSGLLFERRSAADMIGMGMGKNNLSNLLRIPAGLFDIVQNYAIGAGNAAVNQAYLIPEDDVGENKPVHRFVRTHTQIKRYFQGMDVLGNLHFGSPGKWF